MSIRIAINGFGRIGRLTFRVAWLQHPELDIVAVNDPAGTATDALLLEYDSLYGPFPAPVRSENRHLSVGDRQVEVFRERDWTRLPWGDLGVDLVLECSGRGTTRGEAGKHLAAGARRVIISAPATEEDITLVLGVNEELYDPAHHRIISNASCTTHGLAPVVKVLRDQFGIRWGMMSTVHSYTNSQRVQDRATTHPRESRAAAMNIIPAGSGATAALVKILPTLSGRFGGMAFRVPTPTVSVIDLVAELNTPASVEEVNTAFRRAGSGPLKGILDVCDRPLVSMDFKGNSHSAIIDALSTQVLTDRIVKVLSWYDNEWGYSCRLADLAAYVGERETLEAVA